jgi:hypothetical protein
MTPLVLGVLACTKWGSTNQAVLVSCPVLKALLTRTRGQFSGCVCLTIARTLERCRTHE